jgi:predicted HTH transcriptional regulator
LLTRDAGKDVPTVGGLLLFGRRRLERFPDAWLHAGCFAGVDRTDILDMAELRSYLPAAVDEAMAFVRRNSARRVVIRGARREEHPAFPPVAVREAVVNAIVHADYSQRGSPIRIAVFADRLEVENPGMLVPGLTVEDIREGISKLRNRVIGRVFHELGLIEQWGSGIQRMFAACREAALPEPEFGEIGERFRVTLRARHGRQRQTRTNSDDALLHAVADSKAATTAAIAERVGLSTRAVRLRLKRLVDQGLVVEIGTGLTDPNRTYRVAK